MIDIKRDAIPVFWQDGEVHLLIEDAEISIETTINGEEHTSSCTLSGRLCVESNNQKNIIKNDMLGNKFNLMIDLNEKILFTGSFNLESMTGEHGKYFNVKFTCSDLIAEEPNA